MVRHADLSKASQETEYSVHNKFPGRSPPGVILRQVQGIEIQRCIAKATKMFFTESNFHCFHCRRRHRRRDPPRGP